MARIPISSNIGVCGETTTLPLSMTRLPEKPTLSRQKAVNKTVIGITITCPSFPLLSGQDS